MTDEPSETEDLLRRIQSGDQQAVAELFARYRERLRRMVRLRLDRRLQGRLDPSDVLQEAYLDISRRAGEYAANPTLPVFLWLRLLTGQNCWHCTGITLVPRCATRGRKYRCIAGRCRKRQACRWRHSYWAG